MPYICISLLCSPHQQKMFKVGASVIVIFLALLGLAYCYRKKLTTCCSKCVGRKEDLENQDSGALSTEKEEEADNDDVHDVYDSNGTDSDKMIDEEDEV